MAGYTAKDRSRSFMGRLLSFHHKLAAPDFQKTILLRLFLAALDSVFSRHLVIKRVLFPRFRVLRFFSLKLRADQRWLHTLPRPSPVLATPMHRTSIRVANFVFPGSQLRMFVRRPMPIFANA